MHDHCFRLIRQLVEQEIAAILKEEYALEIDAAMPITYYLDFKSNERLLELRNALERMDNGTFGRCFSCGAAIKLTVLTAAPGTQFCEVCEQPQATHFHPAWPEEA